MTVDALRLVAAHLALLLGPLVVAAVVLHQLNVLTTRVLGESFGSGAVVWLTGWLGTPVHELSHAAACVLFAHRVRELVLFRPDPATGVVGYVRYTWSPRNPWALLGHGLVGIAPLFGGALALAGLLFLLAPGETVARLLRPELAGDVGAFGALVAGWLARVEDQAAVLLDPAWLVRPRAWLFGYLALCVGTHLAPSGADLRGAWPSLALLTALLGLADLALVATLGDAGTRYVLWAASLTAPLAALLALAALLVGGAFVVVLAAATAWSMLRGAPLAPARAALRQPWRLAVVAGIGALAVVAG